MADPVGQISEANLGKFLQIVYSDGVMNQLSVDFRDWEMVSKQKVTDEAARSVDFMVQKSLGVAAVQWSKQGSYGAFPSSQQTTNQELSAGFNQIYSTVELEYDLWQRALGSPHKYAEPLALEIQSKGIAQKRLLSAAFHLDGTGVLGTVSAVAAGDSNAELKITFSAGGARYIEYSDKLQAAAPNGDSETFDTGVSVVVVTDKDRDGNWIKVEGVDGTIDSSSLDGTIAPADVLSRAGSVRVNLSTAFNGSLEVNNLAEIMPGLPSLAASDGRKLHGMTMSGITKGTKYDASGQPVDISHIQKGMDKLKTITGEGQFKYKQALSSPETISAFIESQETDRRLVNINDNKRGQKGFGYIHNNDTLELVSSEFCDAGSIWMIPEGAKQGGILELHGKDFVDVKAGGSSEFLKTDGSGYTPFIQKFMMAYMTLICKRPNAILEINNFTV